MLRNSQIRLILALVILAMVLCVQSASAENGWRHWKSGEVTKDVWSDGDIDKVEIDQVSYMFMPDAVVYKVTKQRNGGYAEEPVSKERIYRTKDVEMLVQGFRIYQLRILP